MVARAVARVARLRAPGSRSGRPSHYSRAVQPAEADHFQLRVLEALASARNYNAWFADLALPYLGDDPVGECGMRAAVDEFQAVDLQFGMLAQADGRPPAIPSLGRLALIEGRPQETDRDALCHFYLISVFLIFS